MMVNRNWIWAVGLAALLGTMITVGVAAQIEGDPQRGGLLYVENCAVCHGEEGMGRVGARLTAFSGIDVNAALTQTITNGIDGAVMPAWGQEGGGPLSPQDVADIVAYITQAFNGTAPIQPLPAYEPPPIEPLPDVDGDPSQGAVVFRTNCVVCHGEYGEGRFGAPLAKAWAANQPEVYIFQTVGAGIPGSVMPAWAVENGGPLTETDIENVTAFVLTLNPVAGFAGLAEPEVQEGPLSQNLSLIVFAGLVLVVVVVLVVYYRRA